MKFYLGLLLVVIGTAVFVPEAFFQIAFLEIEGIFNLIIGLGVSYLGYRLIFST